MTGAGPNQLGVFGPQVVRAGAGGHFAHQPRARRAREVSTSTLVLKDSDNGQLIKLFRAAGTAITLPTRPRSGCIFEFLCMAAVSGGSHVITTGASNELYIGGIENVDTDSANVTVTYVPDQVDDRIITINGSTQGGLIGSRVTTEFVLRADGSSGRWLVSGVVLATGAPATNFS